MAKTRGWRAAVLVAAAACAAPAGAQPRPPARAELVQRLTDCRKVTEDAARLACFDAATAALEQAEAKGDIVVVDREQARQVRRQAFGFALPSISLFERGETKEEVDTVRGKVASARADANGKWTVRLDDGAVWTQIDSTFVMRNPKPGMSAKVSRAAMGSFLMSIDGQRAFRARRVE